MSSGVDMPRVLLVEDDADLCTTTAMVLRHHGFAVEVAGDGLAGEKAFATRAFDVVVTDIAMPGMDGLTLARRLRKVSQVPILLLTARDLPGDVVSGLDSGADDYLTKPFDSDVLAARLRALLRRSMPPPATTPIVWGEITVDRAAHTVTRAGVPVSLSMTEFRLLEAFLDHPGTVLSRAQLLRRAWPDEWIDQRVVDTYVQRLRAKLGAQVIETVRGYGYKAVAQPGGPGTQPGDDPGAGP